MSKNDVTALLEAVSSGSSRAYEELIEEVHGELRQMAGSLMSRERSGHTLQPTALVNEAYLRLVRGEPEWENRAHFFGAAGHAMRRILVEHARKRLSLKRGRDAQRVTFQDLGVESEDRGLDLIALDEALTALSSSDERSAKVVELRYFGGYTVEQTAMILETSPATVRRDWTYARAWLYEFMGRS